MDSLRWAFNIRLEDHIRIIFRAIDFQQKLLIARAANTLYDQVQWALAKFTLKVLPVIG